ncbi:MAG TPA: hypothetical protein VL243_08935 [Vicinamibacterales bacterium]|nr:hypothetical protein [Vicinamibacterales bacterium]
MKARKCAKRPWPATFCVAVAGRAPEHMTEARAASGYRKPGAAGRAWHAFLDRVDGAGLEEARLQGR